MGRSNTANGGTSFYDLVIQTVSAGADQYTMRAVVYLTSLNVVDGVNNLSVTGNWSRSGALGLNGVYNNTPVWSQDIVVNRVVGSDVGLSVNAAWSGVEYWGTTLSASASATVPAKIIPPGAPTVGVADVTSTSARIYTAVAGADNGSPTDVVNYRIHRVSDGAHMGDLWGPFNPGVSFTNLYRATAYNAYGQQHNAAGWGGFGGPTGFTTPASVPSTMAAPNISGIGPTSATVSWVAPADNGGSAITEYAVQIATDAGFTTGLATYSAGMSLSHILSTLTPGGNYWARVRSANGVGVSAWSLGTAFTTLTGMRVYNGTAWVNAPVYAWNGSTWVVCEVRIYNGSAWVPTG